METCQRDTGANLKQLPMTKAGTNSTNKINNAVYNPSYKINTHESNHIN